MKHKLFLAAIAMATMVFASCATSGSTTKATTQEVKYQLAQNYFFNPDRSIPRNAVFDTRERFDRFFSGAEVKSKKGRPTAIDFQQRFVIGVVLPLTDDFAEIIPGKLVDNGKKLTLHYRVRRSLRTTSWTVQPTALLIVDRAHLRKSCELKEEK